MNDLLVGIPLAVLLIGFVVMTIRLVGKEERKMQERFDRMIGK